MTGLQEIDDQYLGLLVRLAGNRLERATATGECDLVFMHQIAMVRATQRQRDFRIACAEQGGCFFDAAGGMDAAALKTLAGGAN
jgi:hypothetical protein